MLRRISLLFLLAAAVAASITGGPAFSPPAEARPVREVAAGRVSALVPEKWDFRPMRSEVRAGEGIQASGDLRRWGSLERREIGLEAYWIDAAKIGLPSDYYYLAAEGPAMTRLPVGVGCRRDRLEILSDHRPAFDRRRFSPGDYVATARGTCVTRRGLTRWASFVAAPGYGPVRGIGIPESGLYFAFVMVPDGPRADRRADRLLSAVAFGGTEVAEFIDTARGQV
ncbi:MAG TPA: hypothetical protein VF097_05635 [Actinomycetota bacterium]